ncbi:Hypothetical protein LUCI_4125 [Lucifera butyrica]|uniref:Nudix hydrolase domain-containing protein n=1 Tax=Lucifera butyrica TaxID=1351585 RepID=A0A498RBH1_9FIRM|nr:CoA pyrophosphatase [Lucifera butyrica]VBB08844.1 Hypothetical protein LUCI_4125 [Lucifera butyrica]
MNRDFCQQIQQLLSDRPAMNLCEYDFAPSAVLLPLVIQGEEPAVLFEIRSEKLHRQPGEICFPGGRIEKTDARPVAAALRETCEELGVCRQQIAVLGPLDYVVSPIGVLLYPFVGYIDNVQTIRPNQDEVGAVFTVPLHWLVAAEPLVAHMQMATKPQDDFPFDLLPDDYPKDWKIRTTYPLLFYQYGKYTIWGLTAKVLHNFLSLYKTSFVGA